MKESCLGSAVLIQENIADSRHVWSLRSEEGSLTSPAFVPSYNTLCVSLTYYLPLTAGNSLHLSIHWPGGDKQDFNSIEAVSIFL